MSAFGGIEGLRVVNAFEDGKEEVVGVEILTGAAVVCVDEAVLIAVVEGNVDFKEDFLGVLFPVITICATGATEEALDAGGCSGSESTA
ncbi:hypothetical protein WICPIJ_004838 [Wickerhamomyces pijperi]|uniref:Uncharacterized protein n=1 Tax=Wickerhamomyces pijperi TaxID=599730 RepID=A0A9P8Q6U9_WICPI|nr:hypothetical protein WICPIJ_004838 [Wickerhamomyces pijperi]